LDLPSPKAAPKLWVAESGKWHLAGPSLSVETWNDIAVTLPEQSFAVTINDTIRSEWNLKKWTFDVQRGADAGLALGLKKQVGTRGFLIKPTPTQPTPGWRHFKKFPSKSGTHSLRITSNGRSIWEGSVLLQNALDDDTQSSKTLQSGNWTVQIPSRCFAWKQDVSFRSDGRKVYVSPDLAALKAVVFTWKPQDLEPSLWPKTYLHLRDGRGSSKAIGQVLESGAIRFETKTFGSGEVRTDTKGPSCKYVQTTRDGAVHLEIKDELSIEVVGVSINKNWTWAYYDAKNDDLRIEAGGAKGELRVVVQDELGNRTTFTHNL
jgi:hypothetical protein